MHILHNGPLSDGLVNVMNLKMSITWKLQHKEKLIMTFYSVSSKANFKGEFQIHIWFFFIILWSLIHNECMFQQK